MKTIHSLTLLAALGAALSLTPAALAAPVAVLQDSYAAGAPGGAPTQLDGGVGPWGYELDLTASFSAAGTSKLIMAYSSKDESGNGVSEDFGGAEVTKVTYDGAELETAIFNFDDASFSRVTVGIFYLDEPLTDGILRIELADEFQTEYGLGLYAVDNLKPGVQDAQTAAGSGDTELSAAATITTPSGFVVQETARNNQSLSGDAGDDWVTLYNYSAQSYRGLSQYQIVPGPGSYSAPINNNGSFKRVSTAAFEVVPEPSTLALLGLGGLLIARRRLA